MMWESVTSQHKMGRRRKKEKTKKKTRWDDAEKKKKLRKKQDGTMQKKCNSLLPVPST
jgi:hypothetical protein